MTENKNGAQASATAVGIPQYVIDHAPLVHLSSKDPYYPTPPTTTLQNTRPQIEFKDTPIPTPPLTLANLDQLNGVGSNAGNDVYLTSTVDITTKPRWLEGLKPNAKGGIDGGETTGVIVVVDKGAGVVDAFYFYFWAFNFGGIVLGRELGDHVGDWEHNMLRFENGVPKYAWYSQHANGEAFKFAILKKDASGKRPLVFAANGSHALYATPGTHDHTIPNLNLPFKLLLVDETDAGPIYDPVLSSYFYAYTPSTTTFTPVEPTPAAPTAFLRFRGRWGDEQYPDNDKRQQELVGSFKKYVGGPTGPADKQLERKQVWPENQWSKGQKIRGSLGEGLVRRWFKGWNSFGRKGVVKVGSSGEAVG